VQAGVILYAFSAPSAVMAVPYAIGMAGFVGGSLICIIVTCASVAGSIMLLQVKLAYPSCHTFGQLGGKLLGPRGQVWGNSIQLGNFCLFLPCALRFCALALRGIGFGLPFLGNCDDYYVFLIAGVCLLTTQARTLSNTKYFSFVSFVCVCGMAVLMIVAAYRYENSQKVPAQYFGNPESDALASLVQTAGGFTICAWAYVPAFLTVELSDCMGRPGLLSRSLVLSGVLNVTISLVVGLTVVQRWGYRVGEVITITRGVPAWTSGSDLNTAFNVFQLTGNFVSYMLDSVPLVRFCQKAWSPGFRDTWSPKDIWRYLWFSIPTFIFALLLSTFVPSVNTLLDFTTALTTPMVTQIYPAVCYWTLLRQDGRVEGDGSPSGRIPPLAKFSVGSVFLVGCISLVVCSVKAIGYVSLDSLRPPMSIGCEGWLIWTDSA